MQLLDLTATCHPDIALLYVNLGETRRSWSISPVDTDRWIVDIRNKEVEGREHEKKMRLSAPARADLMKFAKFLRWLPFTENEAPQRDERVGIRAVHVSLGLVEYGGVTLAIYMFGQNMEIFRLLQAARFFDQQCANIEEDNPEFDAFPDQTSTAAVYYQLLVRVREEYRIQLRITLDAVSGTSAGGINAVGLAYAVARNLDFGQLRSTWLEDAHAYTLSFSRLRRLKRLFSFKAVIGGFVAAIYYLVTALPKWLMRACEDGSVFEFPAWWWPYVLECVSSGTALFDGEKFENIIRQALTRMEGLNYPVSDVRSSVTLFTTATNLDAHVSPMHLESSPYAVESNNQNHLTFAQVREDFVNGAALLDSLVLAARTTSAFPFAFAGFRPWDLFGKEEPTREEFEPLLQRFNQHYPAHADFGTMEFADGGLTNNKPFEPILDWMYHHRKMAGKLVDRRLLFLEPHPQSGPNVDEHLDRFGPVGYIEGTGVGDTTFGQSVLRRQRRKALELVQSRANLLRQARSARRNPLVYSWESQGGRVLNAMSSESIREEMKQVSSINKQRRYAREKHLRFLKQERSKGRDSPIAAMFSRVGGQNDEALVQWGARAEILVPTEHTIPGDDLSRYLVERGQDASRALTELFASRRWLNVPRDSEESDLLYKRISENFVFERAPRLKSQGDMVNQNLWFVRDALVFTNKLLSDTCYVNGNEHEFEDPRIGYRSRAIDLITTAIRDLDNLVEYLRIPECLADLNARDRDEAHNVLMETRNHIQQVYERVRHVQRMQLDNTDLSRALRRFELQANLIADHILKRLLKDMFQNDRHIEFEFRRVLQGFWYYDLKMFRSRTMQEEDTEFVVKRLSPDDSFVLFGRERSGWRWQGLSSADVLLRCSDKAHFAGFFERSFRENDMMWGHLDGVEAMCQLICEVVDTQVDRENNDRKPVFLNRDPIRRERDHKAWVHLDARASVIDASILLLTRHPEGNNLVDEIQDRRQREFWDAVLSDLIGLRDV